MSEWIHPKVSECLKQAFPPVIRIARDHGLPTDYQAGQRPRHFAGALDDPDSVQVVLLLAEPAGYPYAWEQDRKLETWLDDVASNGVGTRGGHKFIYDPSHRWD